MILGPTSVTWHPVTDTGTKDRYNTIVEAAGAGVAIAGCRLEIEGAEERDTDDRDTNLIRGRLLVPWANTYTIDGNGHFIIDGDQWEVHGDPTLAYSHVGPHHYEAPIQRWVI